MKLPHPKKPNGDPHYLAWENSWQFKMPPLVSPHNDIWELTTEIPYWWSITSQIWVVLLIGRLLQLIKGTALIWVMTDHPYGISRLISQTSFCRETSGGIAKCQAEYYPVDRFLSGGKHYPVLLNNEGLGGESHWLRVYFLAQEQVIMTRVRAKTQTSRSGPSCHSQR